MGERRFGRVNWLGTATLTRREIARFLNVWTQTVLAPIITAALFLGVFTVAFAARRGEVDGLPFAHFLAPGIVMMAVIQNAFANTSSSLLVSKIQRNIVDTLMPPLSAGELVFGYVTGGIARGLLVALAITVAVFPVLGLGIAHPLWALAFVLTGSASLALLGLIAATLAEKFDQMALITNFVVTPLSFLSGTFYSITVLPAPLELLSRFNPVFYLIDGFRYGVLGTSDADPRLGLAVSLAVVVALWLLVWSWFRRGYKLKA
ncbi:ABC transporter permease [Oceanomicrobium pacificus]|uniref:Transport permease protein n=1 Tax=Oceanomicrobium pacificus TaxID=2692916 RepID=A0A6B0TYV5_9RHOB|nr:ABC transporter permease [Oceanomicrobium pacificus]MXU66875.1 ABC transporter permease [Oceanomicrobium pacificus]